MSDRPYSSSGSGVAGLIPATQWTHLTQEQEAPQRSSGSRSRDDADSSSRRRRQHHRPSHSVRASRGDADYTLEDSSRYAARPAQSSYTGDAAAASHSRVASARFGEAATDDAEADADERYAAALGGSSGSIIARDQLALLRARAEAIVDAEEEERRREYEQRQRQQQQQQRSSTRTNSRETSSRQSNRPASAAPSRSATTSGSHSRAVLAPLDHPPRLSPRPQSASASRPTVSSSRPHSASRSGSVARPTTLSWGDDEAVYLIHNPNWRQTTGQQLEQLEALSPRSQSREQPRRSHSSLRHRRRESSRSQSRTRSRSRSASPKRSDHHHRSRSTRSGRSHSRRRSHSHSRSRSRPRSRSRSRSHSPDRSPPRSPTRSIPLSVHIGDDGEEERIEVFSPHSAREYRLASSVSRPATAAAQRLHQPPLHAHLYSASPSRHEFGPYADPLGRTRSNDQRIVEMEKQEEAAWKAERDAAAANAVSAAASASAATLSSPRRTASRSKFASLARRASNVANAFGPPPPVDINYELDISELEGLFPEEEQEKRERDAKENSHAQLEQQQAAPEPVEPPIVSNAAVAPTADDLPSARDRVHLSHGRSHSLQVAELGSPVAQRPQQQHHSQPQRQHSNTDSVATEIYEPVSASPSPSLQPQHTQLSPTPSQPQSHPRIRLVSDDYDSSVRPAPTASPATATSAAGFSQFVDLRLPRGLSASEMLAAVQQALASPFANEEEAALFREWAREKEQRKSAAATVEQHPQHPLASPAIRSSSDLPPPLPRSQTLDSSDVIPAYPFFALQTQTQRQQSPQQQQQQPQRDFDQELEEKYNTPRADHEHHPSQQPPPRTSSVDFAAVSSSPEPNGMDSARLPLSSPTRGGLRPSRVQTVRELRQSIQLQQLHLQQLIAGADADGTSTSASGAAGPIETPLPSHHAHTDSIPETPEVHHGRHYSIATSTPARSVSSSGATGNSSTSRTQQETTQTTAAVSSAPAPAAAAAAAISTVASPLPVATAPSVAPVAAPVAAAAVAASNPRDLDPLSFDYDFDLPSPSLSWPTSPIASSRRASMHASDKEQAGEKAERNGDAADAAAEEHKEQQHPQPQPQPQLISPHSPPSFMRIPPQPSVDVYVDHYNQQYAQWMAQQKARAQQQQQQQQQVQPQQEQDQPTEEERESQHLSPPRRMPEPASHHSHPAPPQFAMHQPAPYPVSSHVDLRNHPQYRAVYAQYLQHFAQLQMQRAGLVGLPPPPAYAAALKAAQYPGVMPLHAQMGFQQHQPAIEAVRLREEHQQSQQKRAARDERRRAQKEAMRSAARQETESLRRRQHALAAQLREEEELRMLRDEQRKLDDLSQSGRRGLSVYTIRPASSGVTRAQPHPSASSSRHVPDASFSELIASATAAASASANGATGVRSGRSLRPAVVAPLSKAIPSPDHVNPTLILATGFSPPRHNGGGAQGDRRRDAGVTRPRPPAAVRPGSAASAVAAASVAIELATEAANRSRATLAAATAAAATGGRSRKQNHERIVGAAQKPPSTRPLSATQSSRNGMSATDFAAQDRLDRRVLGQQITTLDTNGHGFRPSKAATAAAAAVQGGPHRPSQPAPRRVPLHRQHSFSSRASLHTSEEEEWSTSSEEESSAERDDDDASTVVGDQSSTAASSGSLAANRRGGRNSATAAPSTTVTSHPSTSTMASKHHEHNGAPAVTAQRFDIRVHAP